MFLKYRKVCDIFKQTCVISRNKGTFTDRLRLTVKGGAGGNGLPRYGGIGGKGGNVVVTAKVSLPNLNKVSHKYITRKVAATQGEQSKRYRLLGKPGSDEVIHCPLGVTVETDDGFVLGDLNNDGDTVVVALGGRGGESCNQFLGQKGQKRTIVLDYKLIADVGLIGFPNAGKSTLLKALSRASPKIASYPFTTLTPNVGIMQYDDFRKISVADMPGLIEGAHQNVGLGYKFLKHITRTRLLLFVVDVNGFQFQPEYPMRTAIDTLYLLQKELELYDDTLLHKPALLVVSKMDSKHSKKRYNEFLQHLNEGTCVNSDVEPPKKLIEFDDLLPICSHNTYNIEKLRNRIRELVDFHFEETRDELSQPQSFKSIIHREQNAKHDENIVIV
ncbi:GTP-binding protein 10-like protein [Leptotrombidium deliense]|uniref:GTP-binding protein 10-like protein n=1 Tax=Leptotrombidium deliense TaxID=299467 RepID=A0A443SK58_9ACAR|nr:GTP-binding protein 10-like protein [Leptotrombidium deliense]